MILSYGSRGPTYLFSPRLLWLHLGVCLGYSCLSAGLQAAPPLGGQLPISDPESVGMSSARLARVGEVMEAAIEEGAAPGAVVLVARRGQVVLRQAFGARALEPQREAMTVDTIFDLASLTKVVATATSAMILVESGEISLHDPLADHIPEFGVHGKEEITVLQALTHYSGLRPDIDLDENWTGTEVAFQKGCEEQLVAVPGERFIYSDINYFMLGELVRRVTGQDLAEFSRRNIFEPLGMTDTGFVPDSIRQARIAPTESRDGRMLRGTVHDPTASRMQGVAGHAGLFASADDLAVFAQMILNGGFFGKTRVLSPLGVRRMTTNQAPAGKSEWRGVGFDLGSRFSNTRGDLFPIGSFGHTGFTGTSFWIDATTQTLLLILTSRLHPDGDGNVVDLRRKLATVVAASILDLPIASGPH